MRLLNTGHKHQSRSFGTGKGTALRYAPSLRSGLLIPSAHHEKWDGSGYPRGISGNEIPLEARVFAVIDVWDALSSPRPYRDAWPEKKIHSLIREGSGTHFDHQVVEAWERVFQIPG